MNELEALKKTTSLLEWSAVLLNLGFTFLYLKQNHWAFALGIIGPIPIAIISWNKKLYADIILQLLYVLLSIWGAFQLGQSWHSIHFSVTIHLLGCLSTVLLGLSFGYFLKKKTEAARPYWDSLLTAFSIWATFLMMQGCHENWLYFIVIDFFCILLFLDRKLPVLGGLYLIYLLLALEGYFQWGWITN